MAKAVNTTPRTEPASLNESTLETNVVIEIANLFNSPFRFGFNHRLYRLFYDFYEFDRLADTDHRKCRIIRLTPIEENRRGGWDSKIVIPASNQQNRSIFIQFKSGRRNPGNSIANSIFNFSLRNPNPYVEFEFNNNSGNQQHQTLKNLADDLQRQGLPERSVMYGFPRLTEVAALENLEDDLLLHTTFLSIAEMDDAASKAVPA